MAVPQLQTDQTGHRNKARLGFIEDTAFDASAPFVIGMSEQGRNWSSLLAISYQFVKQWAEKLMELAADAEDLAKRVLRHSHDM